MSRFIADIKHIIQLYFLPITNPRLAWKLLMDETKLLAAEVHQDPVFWLAAVTAGFSGLCLVIAIITTVLR